MTRADRDFLLRFEAAALRPEEWTHAAHLRMAFLQLGRHGWPAAIAPVRDGIRRLNRAQGVVDGAERGYHETLTLCWLLLVADALAHGGPHADFAAFASGHPELLARDRVLRHYSRERLASARARREFVLPDRAPLPRPGRPASIRNGSAPGKDSGSPDPDPPLVSTSRPAIDSASHRATDATTDSTTPSGSRRSSR